MAKTGVRVAITLACTECKRRNYQTKKSKRNTPDRVEFKKYCRWCGQSAHRRTGRRAEAMAREADRPRADAAPLARRPAPGRRGRDGRAATSSFESWAELKKVEWPNQNQVIQGTVVVLVACVIAGIYLWLNDQLWKQVVQKLLLGQ